MSSSHHTLKELVTDISPDEVLAQAKSFFATRPKLYTAFVDKEGPGPRPPRTATSSYATQPHSDTARAGRARLPASPPRHTG